LSDIVMNAKILLIDNLGTQRLELEEAGKVLSQGGLVAFPTETVYGLGANMFNEEAVKKIFTVKNRPQGLPLTLHLSSSKYIERWVKEIPEKIVPLIEQFLPGPLMLIMEKAPSVPDSVTAGSNKIGIRVPHHPLSSALLGLAGIPVVATSANLSGSLSTITAQQVEEIFNGQIDLILDSPVQPMGIESTILDVTTLKPRLLRTGFISAQEISRVLGEEVMLSPEAFLARNHTKELCYNEVWLVKESSEGETSEKKLLELAQDHPERDKSFLLTNQAEQALAEFGKVYRLGDRENPEEIAGNLFTVLIELKKNPGDLLLIEGIKEDGVGSAIMERLEKFSSKIID